MFGCSQSCVSQSWLFAEIKHRKLWTCVTELTENNLARIDFGAWRHAQTAVAMLVLVLNFTNFSEIILFNEA